MSSNIPDQRNWLERLSAKIPGYGGYVDKERRRDTDKLHRERLADRLRSLKNPLNDIMRELSNGGRLFEVGPVDHVIKKLDRIENRVRFASYGYSGFFDVVKIDAARLDSIYQSDLALVERADQVEARVNQLKGQAGTADGLKSGASDLDSALDDFEKAFEGRFNAVNTFNPASTEPAEPGPLFPPPASGSPTGTT
jgi:hypothetical protein